MAVSVRSHQSCQVQTALNAALEGFFLLLLKFLIKAIEIDVTHGPYLIVGEMT